MKNENFEKEVTKTLRVIEKTLGAIRDNLSLLDMRINNLTWRQRQQLAKVEKRKEIIWGIVWIALLLIGMAIAGTGTHPY